MTCLSTKRQSTAYVDGRLRDREQSRITAHLRECDGCATYIHEIRCLRSNLQSLPTPPPSSGLTTKLRIIASREKQALAQTRGSRLLLLWQKWKFRMDELMRPLTIPATGGLLSSVLLFASLALTITTTKHGVTYEVPLMYAEQEGANLVPISVNSDITLNISLDAKGHIQDYFVHDGVASFSGDPGRLSYRNIALPQFPSVLALAHPVTGDISIKLTPLVFRQ
jgi:predicted anti-sigma-YlaC factor YlaD